MSHFCPPTGPFKLAAASHWLQFPPLNNCATLHHPFPRAKGLYLWCTKDDTVLSAVKKMVDANVGALLVFNQAPKVGGSGLSAARMQTGTALLLRGPWSLIVGVPNNVSSRLSIPLRTASAARRSTARA